MDCWTDNIMCDANQCKWHCIEKFFDPDNDGNYEGCLKCDEERCGPAFIKCAGANRRSAGILSDISRVGDQVCEVGHFWNCSQCHNACSKTDDACNAQCELHRSCQIPRLSPAPCTNCAGDLRDDGNSAAAPLMPAVVTATTIVAATAAALLQ